MDKAQSHRSPQLAPPLGSLARCLVRAGLISRDLALEGSFRAAQTGTGFIWNLVEQDSPDQLAIARIAARQFCTPLLDLDAVSTAQLPADVVAPALIRRHRVLPLGYRRQQLLLAMADPADAVAIAEIKFHTGSNTIPVTVEAHKLRSAIHHFLDRVELALTEPRQREHNRPVVFDCSGAETSAGRRSGPEPASAVVDFVNRLLTAAVSRRASDIHLETYEKSFRIRLRIDGLLHEFSRPPLAIAARVTARLKIMARLDIAERRLPQDGRIKLRLAGSRDMDLRVSTLPTVWGEKLVLRMLDPQASRLGINELGFSDSQLAHYRQALQRQQGLILVTGPTGSGKTVTLYSGLNLLNTTERNIATAEDPVEINLDGINQVAINTRLGLDFAAALRAFLRQDPDVVMVGEIRDLNTAEIAVKAAQTGHLVLSTLHTNSAAQTLERLRNLGVPPFNLASSVALIIAQRLLRRLCGHCKESQELPDKVLSGAGFTGSELANLRLYRAMGCERCTDGFQGRTGIYEVVPITAPMSRIIMDGADSLALAEQTRQQGFSSLRQSALAKVASGITSLDEANRLTY